MHRTAKINANGEFPYTQIVGGGPQPGRANWMKVKAHEKALTILVKNLDGGVFEQAAFPPLV